MAFVCVSVDSGELDVFHLDTDGVVGGFWGRRLAITLAMHGLSTLLILLCPFVLSLS